MQSSNLLKLNKTSIQRLVTLGILVLIVVILSICDSTFLSYRNINNVLQQTTPVILTGAAASLLMIAGGIDLSVGSVMALSGIAMAQVARADLGMPLAVLSGVAVGTVIGLVNGLLVDKLHIPPVISTMGNMYIARALSLIFSDGKAINAGLPKSFTVLGRGTFGVLSIPVVLMVIVLLIFILVEKKTLLGKYSFAIGGNRVATLYSGINVHKYTILYYVLTGMMSGFAGTILASRLGVGSPNVGDGFEFDVVVAVVLGGTSMSGGEGSVVGTLIGALIVGFLGNGLNILGVESFYQGLLKGFVLVAAVVLDTFIGKQLTAKGKS